MSLVLFIVHNIYCKSRPKHQETKNEHKRLLNTFCLNIAISFCGFKKGGCYSYFKAVFYVSITNVQVKSLRGLEGSWPRCAPKIYYRAVSSPAARLSSRSRSPIFI